jgi:hypothetical protein
MNKGSLTRYLPSFLMPAAARLRETPFGIAYTQRRLQGVAQEFQWQARKRYETLKKEFVSRLGERRRHSILSELAAAQSDPRIMISVACLSRRFGNRDSKLHRMLTSLVATADDPRRIEVLVKIDLDDDLLHYLRIKREFRERISLKIIASPRGRGAADMHRYYDELFGRVEPASLLWQIATDDAVFVRSGWDSAVIGSLRGHPTGLFIGGDLPFERVIALEQTSSPRGSTATLRHYGTNDYPFCGLPLLAQCRRVSEGIPGWTPFGSSLCVDTFLSTLAAAVWEEHTAIIYVQQDRFIRRTGVTSFLFDPNRSAARTAGILDVTSRQHREICSRIAEAIVSRLTTNANS